MRARSSRLDRRPRGRGGGPGERLATAGAALLLAACGPQESSGGASEPLSEQATRRATPASPVTPEPSPDPGAAVAPSPTTPPADGARAARPGPVTVAMAGDVHGEPPIADLLAAGENPLAGVAPLLEAADLSVVNLETAMGAGGEEQEKAYTFQADPALAPALADGGVDVVNLANNHTGDHGLAGLRETIAHAEAAGLAVVGAGESAADTYAAHVVEAGGVPVAVVRLTGVIPEVEWAAGADRAGVASAYDHERAAAAVETAAERADHVVVTVHWGVQGATCQSEDQRTLAGRLLDAGADVIAGHHSHRVQSLEQRRRGVVGCSLGNFLWYPTDDAARRSAVLQAELGREGETTVRTTPVFIDDRGRPQPADGEHAAETAARLGERPSPCDGE